MKKGAAMFRYVLMITCLPCLLFAGTQLDLTGQWDWIKSYRGGFAGGWETTADLGYSMRMIIRNDSVFTFHNDTFRKREPSLFHKIGK